ncbi:hypothetical protein Ntsu_76880 [Nocardia sp. IFM 10818]
MVGGERDYSGWVGGFRGPARDGWPGRPQRLEPVEEPETSMDMIQVKAWPRLVIQSPALNEPMGSAFRRGRQWPAPGWIVSPVAMRSQELSSLRLPPVEMIWAKTVLQF